MLITGSVATIAGAAAPAPALELDALQIWPARGWECDRLGVADLDDVLVTEGFAAIHLPTRRLLADSSYRHAAEGATGRLRWADGRFSLATADIEEHGGRFVVLGGPTDTVWYHWLFNWAPRLLVARRLRPELFDDPALRIAVHPLALVEPYVAVLRGLRVDLSRCVALDPVRDHRLEHAIVPSFPDQNLLHPALIAEMRAALLSGFGVRRRPGAGRRIFASRQAIVHAKRRIANMAEVEPVLTACGFRIASLGLWRTRDQIDAFHNADLVLGAHGSDLANILFCRPGTRVLVIEHDFNIRYRLDAGLAYLCELLDLRYRRIRMPTVGHGIGGGATNLTNINEDFVVETGELARILDEEALASAAA